MSSKSELNAELQGIRSALDELEIERNKGMIDFGRYLRLKEEYETRKAKLLEELDNSTKVQRMPAATPLAQ